MDSSIGNSSSDTAENFYNKMIGLFIQIFLASCDTTVGSNTGELTCEKIGHVIIKNSINISWTNTEKAITNFLVKQGKKERK
jgi:hypothetical protein